MGLELHPRPRGRSSSDTKMCKNQQLVVLKSIICTGGGSWTGLVVITDRKSAYRYIAHTREGRSFVAVAAENTSSIFLHADIALNASYK